MVVTGCLATVDGKLPGLLVIVATPIELGYGDLQRSMAMDLGKLACFMAWERTDDTLTCNSFSMVQVYTTRFFGSSLIQV